MSYILRTPKLKLLLKHWKPPNILPYRDTLYIEYKDGTTLSLSILSKLAQSVDDYLAGKISEIVIESDYIEVKTDITKLLLLANGLVAEYLFWEGAGNVLHDSSDNLYNATIHNAIWKQLPNGKYVLSFNGTDSYAWTTVNVTSPLTFSFEVLHYPRATTYGVVFHIGVPYSQGGFGLWYHGREFLIGYRGAPWPGGTRIPAAIVAPNAWWHEVLTYNYDTKEYRAYVNDKQIASGTSPHDKATYRLTIGMRIDNTMYYDGDIALIRTWSRTLTKEEVDLLYKLAKVAVPDLP